MQIAPGPVFLYGTSDTTLYYPGIALRYLRHSGDRATTREWRSVLEHVLGWGLGRTDPANGLIRNGGEVEELASEDDQLTGIQFGIDSPDTTIWDSTDRRDHAIDVQVLWRDALLSASELLGTGPESRPRPDLRSAADLLARSLRDLYSWPEQAYLSDSLRNGQPVRRVRPNALRVVSSGILDPDLARAVVRRAALDDLTTSWGVRTLSSSDSGYDPQAYHDGQVWTIATAWAAEAAFAAGEDELGVRYLRTIGDRFEAEGGWANECYRGDRPEAFDSCFLLGFSIGPFLTTLFERLWGLSIDARLPCLEVRPRFPEGWNAASIERLRVGPGYASVDWTPARVRVRWEGPSPLEVRTRAGSARVAGGSAGEISGDARGG